MTQTHHINRLDNVLQNSVSLRIAQNLFQSRDVQRAGWLRYIPFAEKTSSDDHKFWVVFAVHDSSIPYLEFYQKNSLLNNVDNRDLFDLDGPVSKHSLINCQHIASVITPNKQNGHFEFTITLESHVIRLAADTEEVMYDWIDILKTKLISMNILKPVENLYSKSPTLCLESPNQFSINSQQGNSHQDEQELYEPIFNISINLERVSLVDTSEAIPPDEGPPPYECIFSENSQRSIVSFRESQVKKLKNEMEMITGLKLKVRKKDCYNSIAFVDILTYGIFIAGWKQKDHPHLHNTFHIGDQLASINGVVMGSASRAIDFIKQCSNTIEVVVRRIPFGQVFCLKRSFDGEDLGVIRERGTAEIRQIVPNSIAAKAGIFSRCSFYIDEEINNQNWCLTEINNRPLNLFFKNNEVDDRLNAIGKEISILIQPFSFVKRIRKQMKTFRNYKDYVVQ